MMLFHFFLISAISEQVPYRRTFHTDCHTCQVLQGAHSPRCIIRIHKGEMQRFKLSWEACLQLGLPEKSAEQWGSGHTAYLSSQNKMTNLGSFSLSLSLFPESCKRPRCPPPQSWRKLSTNSRLCKQVRYSPSYLKTHVEDGSRLGKHGQSPGLFLVPLLLVALGDPALRHLEPT